MRCIQGTDGMFLPMPSLRIFAREERFSDLEITTFHLNSSAPFHAGASHQ